MLGDVGPAWRQKVMSTEAVAGTMVCGRHLLLNLKTR